MHEQNQLFAELVATVLPFAGCVALVVAFHTQSARRSFFLTFGIFAIAYPIILPSYNLLDTWGVDVIYGGSEKSETGIFGYFGMNAIVNTCIGWLLAIAAATTAWYFGSRRRA